LDPARDYPLATRRPELVRTPGGRRLDELTLERVMSGEVTADEFRITPETLRLQAEIAAAVGRRQLAENLRRAAELTAIPDERILEIYNALRPYRSTKAELLAIADELESRYGARINAAFVREAAEVYERRGRLKA
ncbi:MAG: diol dehydratase small subunit, partial [Firmicutes bacterium]|nr:diol dehydratase small subunit [Bacillota bacterium]